jgi:hypothetical protein
MSVMLSCGGQMFELSLSQYSAVCEILGFPLSCRPSAFNSPAPDEFQDISEDVTPYAASIFKDKNSADESRLQAPLLGEFYD